MGFVKKEINGGKTKDVSVRFRQRPLWALTANAFSWVGKRELATLVVILLILGGTWIFVEIADEVIEEATRSFDEKAIMALRNPSDLSDPLGPRWFEEMVRDFTALGGIGVLALFTLASAAYLVLHGRSRGAWFILAAVAGGFVLSILLKTGFDRPRPDLVPHGVYTRTASFPSGHSMMSAVTYLTLGSLLARIHPRRRVKAYLILLACFVSILVGTSRVYMGVHWPTDVLAGWTLGASWALLCWLAAYWLQRKGAVEKDEPF